MMTAWIKTSDRLPEVGKHVLLRYEGYGICEGFVRTSRSWGVVFLDQHGCGCCGGDGNDAPEYWMEIPE